MDKNMRICHTCKKYKNISEFKLYKNIPNRRCKCCVFDNCNNKLPEPYVIFLKLNKYKPSHNYLILFHQDLNTEGLVENSAASPYIPLTKQFYTNDIESVVDKIFQIKEIELRNVNFSSFINGNTNREEKIVNINFKTPKLKRFLKRLNMEFPVVIPLYKLKLGTGKVKKQLVLSEANFGINYKSNWNISISKIEGSLIKEV